MDWMLTESATTILFAGVDMSSCAKAPLTWGLVCGAVWLMMMIPRGAAISRVTMVIGFLLGVATAALFCMSMVCLGSAESNVIFIALAGFTVGAAAAAICMKSAVYSAIWFAISLVGTAGIYLVQGAQFLSVATIVVYAGAIVVTLLFVVMLAQPDGHDTYDRISWGWFAKPFSIAAAGLMVGLLAMALDISRLKEGEFVTSAKGKTNEVSQSEDHMAHLGAELFSRHLLSIEIAGTLLMVALVGAISIVIQGKDKAKSTNPAGASAPAAEAAR